MVAWPLEYTARGRSVRTTFGYICVAALFLLTVAGVSAAPVSPWANLADPVFVRVDTRQLPNPVIQALAQDESGLMWVGTAAGLASYDGYQFRSYLPSDLGSAGVGNLPSSRIASAAPVCGGNSKRPVDGAAEPRYSTLA